MNLEITIKVPLGAEGVSVTERTDESDAALPAPMFPPGLGTTMPPLEPGPTDRLRPYREEQGRFAPGNGGPKEAQSGGQAPPGPEGAAEMLPPSLGELGVTEPEAVEEVGPPSLESLRALMGPSLDQPAGPPTLEELGAEESPETPTMGPPNINGGTEIEVAPPGASKRSSRSKPATAKKAPAKKRSRTTTKAPTAGSE